MKQLCILFYDNTIFQIPVKSDIVCYSTQSKKKQNELICVRSNDMVDWMLKYPKGKVEFVWLYAS